MIEERLVDRMRKTVVAATFAAALFGFAPPPVMAQTGASGPSVAPTRDVVVTYRMTGREAGEARISWLAAEQKMRMETPQVVLIEEGRENRSIMLMPEQRMFVITGSDQRRGSGFWFARPGDTATREGADRVAGHDCAVWRIEARRENPDREPRVRRACVTADGVPLRVVEEGEEPRTTTATKVEYARQDPAQFRVPDGYRPFDPSAFAPPQGRR
jgi:hypothetical protein